MSDPIPAGEAVSEPQVEGWNDAASAPKSGRWFLGWFKDGEIRRCSWGRNRRDELSWCTATWWYFPTELLRWQPYSEKPTAYQASLSARPGGSSDVAGALVEQLLRRADKIAEWTSDQQTYSLLRQAAHYIRKSSLAGSGGAVCKESLRTDAPIADALERAGITELLDEIEEAFEFVKTVLAEIVPRWRAKASSPASRPADVVEVPREPTEGELQRTFEEWMASSNYPEIADIALEKLPDGNYKSQLTFAAWQAWKAPLRLALAASPSASRGGEARNLDPRDPDHSRRAPFNYHNCWRCNDGAKPCVNGNPRNCENLHARND